MNQDESAFAERLRERFAATPAVPVAAADCADADRIRSAARGELPWPEIESLLGHAAACPACTVAWRLHRGQFVAEGKASRQRWVRYAAAAVVVIAAGLAIRQGLHRDADNTTMRATAMNTIRPAIADGSELPRGAFLLRWTPGPTGTRYWIQVTDERLGTIAEAAAIDAPQFLVPETALAGLAPGARVLWQVKAVYPDGAHVTSDTFLIRVGGSAHP